MFIGFAMSCAMVYMICINVEYESFRISAIIMGRLIIYIPILYRFQETRKNEFIYYKNLGINKWQLLSYIYALDSIIAFIILYTTYAIIR